MGAFRLGKQILDICVYDALGQDADDVATFVCHIGLAISALEVKDQKDQCVVLAKMVEMCPPLVVPQADDVPDPELDRVDVVGSIELTGAEVKQIAIFIEETAKELESIVPRQQYIVHPHFRDRTGVDTVRRYSCAGYVQQAYEYADIDLLDLTECPGVELQTILVAYPDSRKELENPRARAFVGLRGPGPWPVLLPGYIFHAMARDPQQYRQEPYKPKAGDECFPRRDSGEQANAVT